MRGVHGNFNQLQINQAALEQAAQAAKPKTDDRFRTEIADKIAKYEKTVDPKKDPADQKQKDNGSSPTPKDQPQTPVKNNATNTAPTIPPKTRIDIRI